MNYEILHKILISLEEFESKSSNNVNLNDFRIWLNEKFYLKESPKKLTEKFNLKVNELENEICKQIILLGRYGKAIIKKGLDKYPELVNEDFTYLYRLMDYKSITKMQLIDKNSHEKQTGLEIIKRLVRYELIDEFPDPDDGRSKRISVTKKGKALFFESMSAVTTTSKIMSGDLSIDEKKNFLELLIKLNLFHELIYNKYKFADIYEIEKVTGL